MPYQPYYPDGWVDNPDLVTPITAAALNNMETGIANATNQIGEVALEGTPATGQVPVAISPSAASWQTLTAASVGADAAGLASAAQAAAIASSQTYTNAETSRAVAAEALALQKSSNLSDVANVGSARSNLGLGTTSPTVLRSTLYDFTTVGTAADWVNTKQTTFAATLSDSAAQTFPGTTHSLLASATTYVNGGPKVGTISVQGLSQSWTAETDGRYISVQVYVPAVGGLSSVTAAVTINLNSSGGFTSQTGSSTSVPTGVWTQLTFDTTAIILAGLNLAAASGGPTRFNVGVNISCSAASAGTAWTAYIGPVTSYDTVTSLTLAIGGSPAGGAVTLGSEVAAVAAAGYAPLLTAGGTEQLAPVTMTQVFNPGLSEYVMNPGPYGGVYQATITGNAAVWPCNGPANTVVDMHLVITQDSTGGRLINFSPAIQWLGAFGNGLLWQGPLNTSAPGSSTYAHLRWIPGLGWLGVEYLTGIPPAWTPIPATFNATTTYINGFWNRWNCSDVEQAGALTALLTYVPTDVRQTLFNAGNLTLWFGYERGNAVAANVPLAVVTPQGFGAAPFGPTSLYSKDGGVGYSIWNPSPQTSWPPLTGTDAADHVVVREFGHGIRTSWLAAKWPTGSGYPSDYTYSPPNNVQLDSGATLTNIYNTAVATVGGGWTALTGQGGVTVAEWIADTLGFYYQKQHGVSGASTQWANLLANNATLETNWTNYMGTTLGVLT